MTTTQDELNRLSPEKKRALLEQLLREKAGQPQAIPLSSGQERLWFLDRLDPNSPLYNIPTALRLTGELNEQALTSALNEIVRRHEALRTTFASSEGTPVQKIHPPRAIPFATIDLSQLPNGSRGVEVNRRLREAANQPFDLSRDLMIRATLLRLAPAEHILVLVAHHIAADEWSLRVLFKELALLYEARMTGREMTLPELPIQYSDYAAWQREELESAESEKRLDYWRQQLEGCNPNLELPTDAPRTAAGAHHGGIAHHVTAVETLEAAKALSRRENTTLFMTLLAAFDVLLHRYTRQEDILVGSPIAGRTNAETEELIGFFVNTLPLRARLRDDMPFTELLAQIRETTLGAYANQDLPFEKLVETLHPERSASGSPLVQVMFALNTDFLEEQLLPGLRVQLMEVENGTAKFDFTLVAQEERGALKLTAEYDRDLFSSAMVQRLLGHFENLLKSLCAQPERPIARHELLSDAEKKRLLVEWNNTRREYPRNSSISRLVEHWAETRPKSNAVSYGNSTLTYAELNARANQLAHHLQNRGLKRGDVVGLMMERSNEMVVAMLGILKAGGGYLPLDPDYPTERLAFMLNDSGARFLITQPDFANLVANHSAEVILPGTAGLQPGAFIENLKEAPDALDLANLIYTSGSTGTPKGVKIPHRGIVRLVRGTDYMEVAPTDVSTQTSSISFDAATWEIWTALINGAHLVGLSKDELINPTAFGEKLRQKSVTIVFVTTALFNQLAGEAPEIFKGLKYVFFGGEAADPKSVAAVLQKGAPGRLIHAYGPTETTVYATVHWVQDVPANATTIPIGRPIANSTAYIVDTAGNLAPIGVPGELWLGGDGMALGYLNRSELTAERFVPDKFGADPSAKLYRSGDLARFREDGALEFLGRVDTQVKIRGFRIELGEIEAALLKHPAVRKAAALARQDAPGEKRLVGYVETLPDRKVDGAGLKTFLKETLPDFMIPAAFVTLEKMPLLPNGKVDRKSLPAPEWKSNDRVFEAPSNPLEQQIAKIWERVLGVQPIGVADNFFDLGGHSLLAVKLFAQFEKVFERKLPLATLFKAPTIRQLAEIFQGGEKPQAWSTIVDIQPKGTRRPIFWIHSLGGDGGGGFFYYRRLAELLGEDQPSYGIRSPQEPFGKIESMAEYYIRAIKEVQPQGPYQLGGFCFGGVVAYEMARQLQAAGENVSLLAILESSPPNLDKTDLSASSARYSIENVYENLRDFVSHPASEQVEMVRRKAKKVRDRFVRGATDKASQPPPALNDLIDMTKYPKDYVKYAETHWKALETFRPRPYTGTIHLFRARKQPLRSTDPSLGWNSVAPGRVAISVIPGTHESMVQDPNVQILAAKIQEAMRAANAAS